MVYKDDYTFILEYSTDSNPVISLISNLDIKEITSKVSYWESIKEFTGKDLHVKVVCTDTTFTILKKYINSRIGITIERGNL